MKEERFVLAALGLASLALWPWWIELWLAWQSPLMWHGPIAFVLAGVLVFKKLDQLPELPTPLWIRLGIVSAALSVFSLWALERYFLSIFFWLLAAWLGIGGLKGNKALKELRPAFLMPVFGLPLLGQQGFGVLAIWVEPLSNLVASAAAGMLELINWDLIQEGPRVFVRGAVITVGLHCAGIQYFEVLGLLVLLSLYFRGIPKWWGVFVFLLAMAVLAVNSLRVFVVILLSVTFGLKHIEVFDQITGVGFLFLLLPLLWKWPLRKSER